MFAKIFCTVTRAHLDLKTSQYLEAFNSRKVESLFTLGLQTFWLRHPDILKTFTIFSLSSPKEIIEAISPFFFFFLLLLLFNLKFSLDPHPPAPLQKLHLLQRKRRIFNRKAIDYEYKPI